MKGGIFEKGSHKSVVSYRFSLSLLFKGPSGESFCEANNQPLLELLSKTGFFYQVYLRGKRPRVTIRQLKFPFPSASGVLPCEPTPAHHQVFWLGFLYKGHTPNDMLTPHRMSHLPPVRLTHLGKFFIIRDLLQLE